jgi:hypothetical protein
MSDLQKATDEARRWIDDAAQTPMRTTNHAE